MSTDSVSESSKTSEINVKLKALLGEKYVRFVEPVDEHDLERSFARGWSEFVFAAQRRDSGNKQVTTSREHTASIVSVPGLLDFLKKQEYATTDSDLVPGHPRTDENPLHHGM